MSFKVDLARPLKLGAFETTLGVLNCAASNLSTGLETRSDLLLDDDVSDPVTGRFVDCSPSSTMRSCTYSAFSGSGLVSRVDLLIA